VTDREGQQPGSLRSFSRARRIGARGLCGAVATALALATFAGVPAAEPPFTVPPGLPRAEMIVPADNPMTSEKIALGKQIFFDPRWSRSRTVSCASCHDPAHGWADPRRFSINGKGKPGRRHSQTVVNRAFSELQQWSGARGSLEHQALKSSDSDPETVVRQLGAIAGYREQFRRVFGTEVTAETVAKAIAAFERTILSGDSPYDRYRAGDAGALSPSARRGLALFEGKARCAKCHSGFNFTDEGFHNLGVGMDADTPDLGRHEVVTLPITRGAFKTPTLRDVAARPPYMHDGSLATLPDVIAFYDRGGVPNPDLSPMMQPLRLDPAEQADLVAFLVSLTGRIDPRVTARPALPPESETEGAVASPRSE
jgi:cytochrome c peroxidase